MSTSHPLPPKKEVALALLERSSVHVHLDPRAGGVAVPVWFKKQPQLVLQIGLNMPVPIPDLRLDDEGMSCTLSFSRQPFFCMVPWSSVFAMVGDDGRGMVWPDDVPPEIASQARQAEGAPAAGATSAASATEAQTPAKRPAPKRAPAPVEAAAEERPKAKKSRAKKPRASASASGEAEPEIRPLLVAVPSPSSPAEKRGAPRAEAEKKRIERPVEKAERAQRPHRPVAGPPKPKRELPPYLRVVK
jgi:stringent starvation protein B